MIRDWMEANGFSVIDTGGGCTGWQKEVAGFTVFFTDDLVAINDPFDFEWPGVSIFLRDEGAGEDLCVVSRDIPDGRTYWEVDLTPPANVTEAYEGAFAFLHDVWVKTNGGLQNYPVIT